MAAGNAARRACGLKHGNECGHALALWSDVVGLTGITMTGVADPALDLARYVSAISGGDPNSVGKMPDQKVLDMALANLDKIFGQGPEKAADAEGVLNVVCFLFQRVVESITASEAAKLAETVTSKLAADTECAPIRLKTMASIYNICRGNGGARFKTFMVMVSYASAAGKAEFASVFPASDKLDALLSEWGTDESNTREVYSVLMAAAEKHGNSDDLHALRLKVLATFQGKPASADALQQASKAVSEVLGNPLIFQFDTYMQLDAIQALKSDAAHAPVYALLELFCTEDLGAYNAFCNKNAAVIAKLGLDKDLGMLKMRLLTLCSLASRQESISYADIAKGLEVPEAEVEVWAIKAMQAQLLDAKLDQLNRCLVVGHCAPRLFANKEWAGMRAKLVGWRSRMGQLQEVLTAARAARDQEIALMNQQMQMQ